MSADQSAGASPERALLELLGRAETRYEQVSLDDLRRLARDLPSLAGRVGRLLHAAVARGEVVWDDRLYITRSGRCVTRRVYRLNRRHPAVQAATGVR